MTAKTTQAKAAVSTDIKNRIIGSGEVDPKEIKGHVKNWRKHPQAQRDALEGVLKEVGWVQEVIVNKRTGSLVDGHLRVSLALQRKEKTIPVKYVELSEAEEALVLATIDPISAMAETDAMTLDNLLRDVSTGDAAVQQLLADIAEKADLYDIEPIEMPEIAQNEGQGTVKTITFILTGSQEETVNEALKKAQSSLVPGTTNKNAAALLIIAEAYLES